MDKVKLKLAILASFSMLTHASFASVYCPQGGGFLKVGMSKPQVIQACGQPTSKTKTEGFSTRNVATKQLFYKVGRLPGGFGTTRNIRPTNTGLITMMITVTANKVDSITLNGAPTNGVTICKSGPFKIGSSLSDVLRACGQPSVMNDSYKSISQNQQSEQETWIYKVSDYKPSLRLTFTNGILESIQN